MLSMFLFSGCAELDGVFPKFKPQNDQETPAAEHSAASVAAKQEELSEENRQLLAKIEQLEQQISTLQNQQNKQRDDFQLLQQQWETNFSLLESSVEQSLNSNMTAETPDSINTQQTDNQLVSQSAGSMDITPQGSLPAFENYSLLQKTPTETKTGTSSAQEMAEINDLDSGKQEIIEEEPGFAETEEVNHDDLEDPEDLPDPEVRALPAAESASETTPKIATTTESPENKFSDPDLNPPDDPFILIRHPGVKRIYNQGMTAVIKKDHNQAILVFENFTERFPNDLDSDNAFYWIGRSHFELNELEKAEEAFRKVLTHYEHRPTSQGYKTPDSIYMLGKLNEQRNLHQRAAYYFEEVIKRFPGSAAARNAERDLGRIAQ
ncbi:MAG: Cell division coordinator CpoB [Deltaproteobacteria bacterium]|nr:Cell division coordinator CpoB [Deltaproteobacteria bacterium]